MKVLMITSLLALIGFQFVQSAQAQVGTGFSKSPMHQILVDGCNIEPTPDGQHRPS